MTDIAVERSWYVVSPEGVGYDLILRVGAPVKRGGDWACSVSLGVLETRSYTLYGVDSWQAVQLAILFIARRIADFSGNGWKFYWEKDGDEASPNDLLEWHAPL
jgi:hypothetical protein